MDLSSLDNKDIELAIEELEKIVADESLPRDRRLKAKEDGLALINLVEAKQQENIENVRMSRTDEVLRAAPTRS